VNTFLGIALALLLIGALVLFEVNRAIQQAQYWEHDEHEQGGP
jgi:hypothetical protein